MQGPIEILLIEDNPGDVALAKATLQESKLHVGLQVALDGEAALQMLRKQGEYHSLPTPDLILLDLNLPRRNGQEVLTEIKADSELRRIPVVVLTSSSAETDVIKSYDLGANCYITKPVDLDQFEVIVQSIEHFWFSVVCLPPTDRLRPSN